MAIFDTAHRDLYIACTGDSRAIAGVWEEAADGGGRWRVEVLSEDQTGRNPNELRRYVMRSFLPTLNCGRVSGFSLNTHQTKQTMLYATVASLVD